MAVWFCMPSTKVTFTFDESTLSRLQEAATRLAKPKSEIVREAIREFHARIGRLSEGERIRMLRAFDELVPKISSRSAAEVDRELLALRKARQMGGRRTSGPSS